MFFQTMIAELINIDNIKNSVFIHFEGNEINDSENDLIRIEDENGDEKFYIAGKIADENFCTIDDIAKLCDIITVIPMGDNIEKFDLCDYEALAVSYDEVA